MNPQRRCPEWRYALRLAYCERRAAQLVREGLALDLITLNKAEFTEKKGAANVVVESRSL